MVVSQDDKRVRVQKCAAGNGPFDNCRCLWQEIARDKRIRECVLEGRIWGMNWVG